MRINFSVLKQRYRLFSGLLVAIAFVILVLLGNWQLKRLDYKNEFIKSIEHNIANPASYIDSNSENVKLYSKVRISGEFLSQKDALLYGRRSASPEKDGYYLLSPFKSDSGKVYLVSRGWVPQSRKASVKDSLAPIHEEIIAIAMPGEKRQFFMPENDLKNGVWFTLDLETASTTIDIDPSSFYLMQVEAKNLPEGVKPLFATHLSKIRNDHLEYAVTWYILAICLVGFYIIYHIKNPKNL
jgi:surfeit locus 1 family protein